MYSVPSPSHYNIGIEIEAIVRPYGGWKSYTPVDWYRLVADNLRNRGLPAVHDDCQRYQKHPEYAGGKWFVTRDGSLKRESPYVCMEVVSPVLNTQQALEGIVTDFWEAMSVQFDPQPADCCGGHVHVTPMSSTNRFTLAQLKSLAFATVYYEEHIQAVLPEHRRTNAYCKPNSQSVGQRGQTCQLRKLLSRGKTTSSIITVAREMRKISTEKALCDFMQADRYVLWNFRNLYPTGSNTCIGTVEFRGGAQFLSTSGVLSWIAFVTGFMTFALEKDVLADVPPYRSPADQDISDWWDQIIECAERTDLGRDLPRQYYEMNTLDS